MGCNAWNHASNCTCGWGGDGHLGRRALFTDLIRSNITFRSYRDLHKGFTNPNAKCPVCIRPVFFYTSPYGGRVFFDELGPPWTKHPCTDSGRMVTVLTITTSLPSEHVVEFERNGWVPFLCQDISPVRNDPSISKLTGLVGNQKLTLFVIKDGLSDDSPFLIKFGTEKEIWLSTIISTKTEVKADTFRTFEYESNLRTLMRPQSKIASVKQNQKVKRDHVQRLGGKNEVPPLHENSHLSKCPECSNYVDNLAKHIKKAHTNQNLTLCPDCGQKVKSIEIHFEKTHSPKATIRIEKRKELQLRRRLERKTLQEEKKEISKVARKGKCPFCKFKFTSELALIAHLIAVHNKDPKVLIGKS